MNFGDLVIIVITIMNLWKWAVILIVFLVLAAGAFQLIKNNNELREKVRGLSEKLEKIENENRHLNSQVEYLKVPENLLKAVKEQFNYRRAGEELIIIVPGATSSRP